MHMINVDIFYRWCGVDIFQVGSLGQVGRSALTTAAAAYSGDQGIARTKNAKEKPRSGENAIATSATVGADKIPSKSITTSL